MEAEPSPKSFQWGGFAVLTLRLSGGFGIIKLTKTPLIYSVSYFNLGWLGALFEGLSPPKPLRGDGTAWKYWIRFE